jgi:hypothetical protein
MRACSAWRSCSATSARCARASALKPRRGVARHPAAAAAPAPAGAAGCAHRPGPACPGRSSVAARRDACSRCSSRRGPGTSPAGRRVRSRCRGPGGRTARTGANTSSGRSALPSLSRMRCATPSLSSWFSSVRCMLQQRGAGEKSVPAPGSPANSASVRSMKVGRQAALQLPPAAARRRPPGSGAPAGPARALHRGVDGLQRVAPAAGVVAQRAHAADLARQHADGARPCRAAHSSPSGAAPVVGGRRQLAVAWRWSRSRAMSSRLRQRPAGRRPGRRSASRGRGRGRRPRRCRRPAAARRCARRCAAARRPAWRCGGSGL